MRRSRSCRSRQQRALRRRRNEKAFIFDRDSDSWFNRSEGLEPLEDEISRLDEIDDELIVDVYVTLILGAVSSLVAEGKDSPDLVGDSQCVGKALEDDVPVLRAIAVVAKRGERKGVRSIVREIEAALGGQRVDASVIEPHSSCTKEPIKFLLVARLRL